MKRRICVVTGTRAEYGLLYWVIKGIQDDVDLELQLVVTGMHLSPEFGLTYKQIETDGFNIDKKIEILLSSDTSVGITKSVGLGAIGFADALSELKPDIVLLLGDRFEILSVAIACMIAKIPVAHCHGGESTEGLIDEAIRHSITKMSQLHFVSTDIYRLRVCQLGEQPGKVFNVGALGIENINKLKLLEKDEFERSINFKTNKRNLLITFHPVTLDRGTSEEQFKSLLDAVDELKETSLIFTKPNADTEGRIVIKLIDEYVHENEHKAVAFVSMGQLRYLSALKFVDAVLGNSSSGLIEAPSFQIGTINIGDRQRGRVKGDTVIDCIPQKQSILNAIYELYTPAFQLKLKNSKNIYGNKNSSGDIIDVLKSISLDNIVKKEFFDVTFEVK